MEWNSFKKLETNRIRLTIAIWYICPNMLKY